MKPMHSMMSAHRRGMCRRDLIRPTISGLALCAFLSAAAAAEPGVARLSLATYNLAGKDKQWTLNTPQVKAIGRQLGYLKPDIIGLQEVQQDFAASSLMGKFIESYLPGYHLAVGSHLGEGTRLCIVSRFPIARSQVRLNKSSLEPFGFDGRFYRELLEAEIIVPGLDQPLHFFNTHLKSFARERESRRRAAEARAISNYLAHVFVPAHPGRPYVLVGDLNEDPDAPGPHDEGAIPTLACSATGLKLTTPVNPVSNSRNTHGSRRPAGPRKRLDYVLPCEQLAAGGAVLDTLVFRSDLVRPPVTPVKPADSRIASDHLPVRMTFSLEAVAAPGSSPRPKQTASRLP